MSKKLVAVYYSQINKLVRTPQQLICSQNIMIIQKKPNALTLINNNSANVTNNPQKKSNNPYPLNIINTIAAIVSVGYLLDQYPNAHQYPMNS
jgi:hypothetical protein